MTQAELDALPEDGGFGQEERVIDGRTVRVPVVETVGALFSREGEPGVVTDLHGRCWRVGWANGVRYKQRVMLTALRSPAR
jgi:hypothetical protein